jgi:hypothetical protein
LPALADVHAISDFYAWLARRPGLNAYDIAASWMRYLLDKHGTAKVRRYYKGAPVKAAFGEDLATLEKAWHAHLAKVRLRPGLEALLRERAGGPTAGERNPAEARLSDAILGPASEWRDLARAPLVAGDPGRWERRDGAAVLVLNGVKSQGDWCVARVAGDRADDALGDAMVRVKATPLDGCFGVQVQIGSDCQGMVLRDQGAFVYTDRGGTGHHALTQLGKSTVEIVFRRRQGKGSLWIDGKLVAEGPVPGSSGLLGLGSVGGPARFSDLAVRRLE